LQKGITPTPNFWEDPEVDAVAITLGHQLHHRLTVDACNAGKHVLVEKPMAISLEQCDQMMQAADDNNVKLMIGLTQHFYGTSLKAKEILDSGQLSYPPPTAAPIVDMSFRPN
jgi:glucose-fructose oxidoreductase